MKYQFKYGGWRYVSFIVLDLFLLAFSNSLAAWLYIPRLEGNYSYASYAPVVFIMLAIDIAVTLVFDTLKRALRQSAMKEVTRGVKHVGVSFIALAVILYSTRHGADYSRVTVFLAYIFYYSLAVLCHIGWRWVLQKTYRKGPQETALLMTTDGFAEEGLEELKKINIDVKGIWLLKRLNKDSINGIHIAKTWEETSSMICWQMLDRVYIYGLDHNTVPPYLIKACREMGLDFNLVDFNYRVFDITTVKSPDPKYGSLSFLEGKRDIPFQIRRVYWITETEAELHRGFHAHKLNCQLLYCPHGKIDLILDDGQKRDTVTLDRPEKGLILMPGLWREMIWRESGSVLCVLASEYYDADEYIRDYDQFLEYNKKYRGANDPLTTAT